MDMGRVSKRDQYEREFIVLVEEHSNFIGQRGTHTDGIDVILYRSAGARNWCMAVRCEVKTSVNPTRHFSRDIKLQKQHDLYVDLLKRHNIMTFYCFRLLTKKKVLEKKDRKGNVIHSASLEDAEDKWRIFRVDRLPHTPEDIPMLNFFDPNAMTFTDFLRMFN